MSESTIQELIEKLVPDAVLTALSRKPEKVKAVLIELINQYARAEGEITELSARVADLEKDAGRYPPPPPIKSISCLGFGAISGQNGQIFPKYSPPFPSFPQPRNVFVLERYCGNIDLMRVCMGNICR